MPELQEPAAVLNPPSAAPVDGRARIGAIDALRGFAVLGILVMNVYAFAMPFAAYANPLIAGGTEAHNLAVWFVTHIFFDQKFMTIFSMLFGAGIVLMTSKAEAQGAAPAGYFYRRQSGLLFIGVLHAYLLWFGDILFFYAVTGMIVYALRRLQPRTLIVAGCLLLAVAPLISWGAGGYLEKLAADAVSYERAGGSAAALSAEQREAIAAWEEIRATILPGPEEIAADVEAYRGSYVDIFRHRAPLVASFQLEALPFFAFWRTGGLMLIGMALLKLGILSGGASSGSYRRLAVAGYATGLPLCLVSGLNAWAHDFDALYMLRVGQLWNYVGSVLVALGHVGAFMLLIRSGRLRSFVSRCAATGRMALTNYLLQSAVMTSVFYGYGLGLYGQVPRVGQMALAALLIALQLRLSPWWMSRFRFGPAEWAWRSLTYGRLQPLRR